VSSHPEPGWPSDPGDPRCFCRGLRSARVCQRGPWEPGRELLVYGGELRAWNFRSLLQVNGLRRHFRHPHPCSGGATRASTPTAQLPRVRVRPPSRQPHTGGEYRSDARVFGGRSVVQVQNEHARRNARPVDVRSPSVPRSPRVVETVDTRREGQKIALQASSPQRRRPPPRWLVPVDLMCARYRGGSRHASCSPRRPNDGEHLPRGGGGCPRPNDSCGGARET